MADFRLADDQFEKLLEYGLVYLASPYTKYPYGHNEAALDAARITGRLLKHKIKVFSPVTYTHHIAVAAGIDPTDYDFWMDIDYTFMDRCDALVVAQMIGWEKSYGIGLEIEYFVAGDKPIYYLELGTYR